jgi:hypothetical protein
MRHTDLIDGYIVDYTEHTNKWSLLDSIGKVITTKDSLRELRDYVQAQEKHERKEKFLRQPAYLFSSSRFVYGDVVPVLVTVTSKDNHIADEYWVSIPSKTEGGMARRSRVHSSHLHAVCPANDTIIQNVKKEIEAIDRAQERRRTELEALEKFVPKPV